MNNIEVAQLLLNRLRLSSVAYIDTQQNGNRPATALTSYSLEFNMGGDRVNEVRGLPPFALAPFGVALRRIACVAGVGPERATRRRQVFLRAGDGLASVSSELIDLVGRLVTARARSVALAVRRIHSIGRTPCERSVCGVLAPSPDTRVPGRRCGWRSKAAAEHVVRDWPDRERPPAPIVMPEWPRRHPWLGPRLTSD